VHPAGLAKEKPEVWGHNGVEDGRIGPAGVRVLAHRTVHVKFDHFKQRFSARKLIPVNVKSRSCAQQSNVTRPKSLGDYLLLKRIEADLSQPELAIKSGASVRKVKAWEHDHITPTEAEWQVLADILRLDSTCPKT
jgi:DNA-binding transcriptional regulator YiaG